MAATVSPAAATGKVTFYDATTILGVGTLAGGQATLRTTLLPAGKRSLTALYAGDTMYSASVSSAVSLTVRTNFSAVFTPTPASPIRLADFVGPVTVGDFNGDGKADLALNYAAIDNGIVVMLGDGNGNFTPSSGSPTAVPGGPVATAVGDFNGDGISDLVITNPNSTSNVTVLLGDGTGNFTPAAGSPFTAVTCTQVVVADFNGDGKADLVVTSTNFNATVLLGDGMGAFTMANGSPLSLGAIPSSIAVADFNGDGKQDLAFSVPYDASVLVLVGDGSGHFAPAQGSPFLTGGVGGPLAVTDFNGDGKLDIVVVDDVAGELAILLGDGSGGFTPITFPDMSATSRSMAVGDFNGDGRTDLVITNGELEVLLGALAPTTTTLAASANPSLLGQPLTLTATVSASGASGTVTFYDGTTVLGEAALTSGAAVLTTTALPVGSGSTHAYYSGDAMHASSVSPPVTQVVNANPAAAFVTATGSPLFAGSAPHTLATGDFNGDGHPDLATFNQPSHSVTVLLGNGNGSFTQANGSPISVAELTSGIAVGDINGDGNADIISLSNTAIAAFLADGHGGFAAPRISPTVIGPAVTLMLVADFNGDGKPDLAVLGPGVFVALGDGTGLFTPTAAGPVKVGNNPTAMALGDFNGDGKVDIVVVNLDNDITVILGDGNGGFTPANGSPFAAGVYPTAVAVADFNGDGKADIAVTNGTTDQVTILFGNGDGTFRPSGGAPLKTGSSPNALAVLDFNGDGRLDLAVANLYGNNISVFLGNGQGGFTPAFGSPFATGGVNPTWLVTADFNGDGRSDLATANFSSNSISVLLGSVLDFFPITPCRAVDTRNGQGKTGALGPPSLLPSMNRDFPLLSSACGISASAAAYSLNFTVVPPGPLDYLSVWPAGQAYPGVSTLNSTDGSTLANAAIVPAGASGAITVLPAQATDLIVDANGYFAPPNGSELSFYLVNPCRVVDTRNGQGKSGAFGPPALAAGAGRNFPISGSCGVPSTARAYSLNLTALPAAPLPYLSTWPADQAYPNVSTLNSPDRSIIANAAIVPAASSGDITVLAGGATNLIIDVDGYFALPGSANALHFYPVTPCRVADTRPSQGFTGAFGPPGLAASTPRDFSIATSKCNIPATAQAYSLNMTVVPSGPLSYLSTWPAGQIYPNVSTLNSPKGTTLANAAIVRAGASGAITVMAGNPADLIIDINGYFAP